jgi:hypothetical protein
LLFVGLEPNGYITGAPIPSWLGLATLGGRDAIELGDGCGSVVPGVNVILDESGLMRVVDPMRGIDQDTCVIVNRLHMSDMPCATNQSGTCDVAFS